MKNNEEMKIDLLSVLNPIQREAVTSTEGPLLILAGAGSGKTLVLTCRVAYLTKEKGISPHSILAITFTNKAADEMKERIIAIVGRQAYNVWTSTFHAACARILRQEISALGYSKNFVVYDDKDSHRLVVECLKESNIDPKQYAPSAILNQISLAKNELKGYEEYAQGVSSHFEDVVSKIYKRYQERLTKNNALDFDDLLVLTVRIFQMFPNILERYQQKFEYILVDEYQDTNHAQYMLVKLLAKEHRNLAVVGDDDQSVYGWRGADMRNIFDFEKDFPEAKVIHLEQNYRSTQIILEAANYVISNNVRRKPKTLWTTNAKGEAITVYQAESEYDEATFIAQEIERIVEVEKRDYRDFAVFYRTNAQSRVIEEVFLRHGIPYKIVGGLKFYERSEIKDMLAYLRLLVNPSDDISFKRVINSPRRGIGKTTMNHLELFAARENISLFDAAGKCEEIHHIGSVAKKSLKKFCETMRTLKSEAKRKKPAEVINLIAEKFGYIQALKEEKTIEAEGRIDNIKELVSFSYSYSQLYPSAGIEEFLERISLITDIDSFDESENAVSLMTLHNAKGLEFPVVMIIGMEEGLFPHSRSMFDREQLEEERRLCYVGITRAKERLYLSNAWRRAVWGSITYTKPSRFLKEIPEHLLYAFKLDGEREPELEVNAKDPPPLFVVGESVKHKHFGFGCVKEIQSGGKVVVDFDEYGEKVLLIEYAPLEKVQARL